MAIKWKTESDRTGIEVNVGVTEDNVSNIDRDRYRLCHGTAVDGLSRIRQSNAFAIG